MTDGFREIRGTLGRARRLPSMRRANRATCGFIGLVRVSRGSRLASACVGRSRGMDFVEIGIFISVS